MLRNSFFTLLHTLALLRNAKKKHAGYLNSAHSSDTQPARIALRYKNCHIASHRIIPLKCAHVRCLLCFKAPPVSGIELGCTVHTL